MYSALLVDDNAIILEDLRQSVPWEEYSFERLYTAKNGMQALEVLQNHPVDLLLADIRMPVMDGLTLIRQVRDQYPAMRCVLLSAYDEFEYAKTAITLRIDNYLLKPLDESELLATLRTVTDRLREQKNRRDWEAAPFRHHTLTQWACGDLEGPALAERCDLAGIRARGPCCAALVRRLGDAGAFDTMLAGMQAALSPHCDVYAVKAPLPDCRLLILCGVRLDVQSLRALLSAHAPGPDDAPLMLCTLGPLVQERDLLSRSYGAAAELQQHAMLFGANEIITPQQPQAEDATVQAMPNGHLERLLAQKDPAALRASLTAYVRDILSDNRGTLHVAKAYLIELILSIARQHPVQSSPPSLQRLLCSFHALSSQAELLAFMEAYLDQLGLQADRQGMPMSPLIQRAIRYIEAEYGDAVSIKHFSAICGANASYLGFLFKQETGMYFSEYVSRVRLLEAQRLLLTTGHTAAAIAEKTGFHTASYFTQCFRKAYHMTPNKYRQLYKK